MHMCMVLISQLMKGFRLKVCFFGVGHAKYKLNNKISKCIKQLLYFGVPLLLKGELKDLIAFNNWPLINGL